MKRQIALILLFVLVASLAPFLVSSVLVIQSPASDSNASDNEINLPGDSVNFSSELSDEPEAEPIPLSGNSGCIIPENGMSINESSVFCQGTYTLLYGLSILGNNTVLDCNNSILQPDNSNNVSGSATAIYLYGTNNTIKNCNISRYGSGIYMVETNSNLIESNYFQKNSQAISLYSSQGSSTGLCFNNIIKNNIFIDNIYAFYSWWADSNTFKDNTIECVISYTNNGFFLYNVQNSKFINNTIKNCSKVTDTYQNSSYNLFENNSLYSNNHGFMFDSSSDHNTFRGNSISNGLYGFSLSNSNIVVDNNLSNNYYAIALGSDYNSTISDNNLINNEYGISLGSGIGTLIYRNNFINNSMQLYGYSWNNYPYQLNNTHQGNYWSNYDNSTEGCDDINNNGICDLHYNNYLTGLNDYLPFREQSGWLNTYIPIIIKIPDPYNLVKNPDFEGLSNWFKPSNSGIIIQNMSELGQTFARITIPNSNNIYCWNANVQNPSHCNSLMQNIGNVPADKNYVLKAKVRMPVGTQAKIEIYALQNGAWTNVASRSKTASGTGNWTDIEVPLLPTTSSNNYIQIRLITLSPNQANIYTDWTSLKLYELGSTLSDNAFLLDLANKTYNYFQAADSNKNGFLDGSYDPLVSAPGLIYSIGRYDGFWSEFDELSPVNYTFNVGTDLPNHFPRLLSDTSSTRTVAINFDINSTQRQKELSLFLNTMPWGGAINTVQLYLNNNLIEQFSLGSSFTEKNINFSANKLINGRNTIKIQLSCTSCGSWFVWDSIQLGEKDKIQEWHKIGIGEYFDDKASPEEVGFYLLSHIGAYQLGFATKQEAISKLSSALTTLKNKPKSNGLFYRYYYTHKEELPQQNNPIPSIGNAMLAASLMTIKQWAIEQNISSISNDASSILSGINLRYFWDNSSKQFYHDSTWLNKWNFYSDEGRLLSFVALALNQISVNEFSANLASLDQTTLYYDLSTGKTVANSTAPEDIKVERVSWDSSMFTYFVPSLFIQEYRTEYQTNTLNPAVKAQIEYAKSKSYSLHSMNVWGISDAFNPSFTYCWEYEGAPPAKAALSNNPYESCPGLITPHASALALLSSYSADSIKNLKNLANSRFYDAKYGFKDSIDTISGNITNRFLTLDQEWIFLSLMNKLNGTIWNYFYKYPGVSNAHNIMYPGSNLVKNPDFSSGLSNWFKPSNSGIIIQNMSELGQTFARITIPNANNIYCWNANISNPSHCNSLIQDILNTMPNKTYALKAKVRMPVGTQAKLEIYALPWAGAFSKTKTINGNGSWQDINISITTTSANKNIQIRLVTLSPNQANTYTDWTNVTLSQA